MLTPLLTICCRLVRDMKTKDRVLSALASMLAGLMIGVLAIAIQPQPEPEEPSQIVEAPPEEEEVLPPVDNLVDNVENEEVPPAYTDEELEILAIIIYQEAGGDGSSDDTRRKVGSVFLNRVNHSAFPDTFEGVATGKRQYGTLYWTGIVWPDRAVNPGEAHAVERAYRIAEELLISGSVLPGNVIWQAEFEQGDGVYCYQDGTYFCYSGRIE